MGAQPPEIEHHRKRRPKVSEKGDRRSQKKETKGLRKRRPGVSITDTLLRSLHQENL